MSRTVERTAGPGVILPSSQRGALLFCVALSLIGLPISASPIGALDRELAQVEDASDASARVAIGLEALRNGDPVSADSAFREALEITPTNVGAMLGLARSLESQRDYAGSLRWTRQAAALEPTPVVLTFAAALAVRVERFDDALTYFAKLRAVSPNDPSGYVGAALVLHDEDRPNEAVETLESALTAGVESESVLTKLGFLYLDQGDATRALELGLRAWTGAESAVSASLVGLASADRFEVGEAADQDALGQETLDRLKRALGFSENPSSFALRLARARVLTRLGRHEESLEDLDAAVALDPEAREAHYERGIVLRELGREAASEASFARFEELMKAEQLAEDRTRDLGIALNEAQQLAQGNDLPGALAALEPLRSAHPEFAPISALTAKVLFSMGRRDEALMSIRRARELEPARSEYHYLEAAFLASLEDWSAAQASAEQALAIDPGLEEAQRLVDDVKRRRHGGGGL